jgi:hypothetical protein
VGIRTLAVAQEEFQVGAVDCLIAAVV